MRWFRKFIRALIRPFGPPSPRGRRTFLQTGPSPSGTGCREAAREGVRACAKITWRNARSGSDQCSIPNAQFLSEQREAVRVPHPLRLRIAHWELNIGQILGLMRSSGYCQVIFARALRERVDAILWADSSQTAYQPGDSPSDRGPGKRLKPKHNSAFTCLYMNSAEQVVRLQ